MSYYDEQNERTNALLETLKQFSSKTTVLLPEKTIEDRAVYEICKYVASFDARYSTWWIERFVQNEVGLELVNRKGKFAKRFAAAWHKVTGMKLTPAQVSEVGNIANRGKERHDDVLWVDVTATYDWDDGQYGHRGSCYWGEYAASRDTLEGASVCLRLYSSERDWNGSGRCWVVPVNDDLVLFNAYGWTLETCARVIRQLTGGKGEFKRVDVSNSPHNYSIPYINDGAGLVFWTGKEPEGEKIYLGLPVIEGKYYAECRNTYVCEYCGHRVAEDDVVFVYDEPYCADCASEHFSYCEACGEYHDADTVHDGNFIVRRYYGTSTYNALCEEHLRQYGFVQCDHCLEYGKDVVYDQDTGNSLCDDCFDGYFCDDCGEAHTSEPELEVKGRTYCSNCAHRHEPEAETEE